MFFVFIFLFVGQEKCCPFSPSILVLSLPFCQARGREREREHKTNRHTLFQRKANTNLDRQIADPLETQVFNGQSYRGVPERRHTGSNTEEPVGLVRSTHENVRPRQHRKKAPRGGTNSERRNLRWNVLVCLVGGFSFHCDK